jgi:superfamily II DNA or RNA helicase
MNRDELAAAWGINWFPYQIEALDGERHVDSASLRTCLYFRTGAGKTYTALALMAQAGMDEVLVIAPLRTHDQWAGIAAKAGIKARVVTHQKYRRKGVKFPRLLPVIVDEFHMLGGHGGDGWDKLRVHAKGLQAPLVILSATPNYNDAERRRVPRRQAGQGAPRCDASRVLRRGPARGLRDRGCRAGHDDPRRPA